jgi:hypothetical protein
MSEKILALGCIPTQQQPMINEESTARLSCTCVKLTSGEDIALSKKIVTTQPLWERPRILKIYRGKASVNLQNSGIYAHSLSSYKNS